MRGAQSRGSQSIEADAIALGLREAEHPGEGPSGGGLLSSWQRGSREGRRGHREDAPFQSVSPVTRLLRILPTRDHPVSPFKLE